MRAHLSLSAGQSAQPWSSAPWIQPLNTTFKHVRKGLRGYIQHKHRGPGFLIMGTLK